MESQLIFPAVRAGLRPARYRYKFTFKNKYINSRLIYGYSQKLFRLFAGALFAAPVKATPYYYVNSFR